jgi:acetate kinase
VLVLALNVGSSSLKSAVFDVSAHGERRVFAATVMTGGTPSTATITTGAGATRTEPCECADGHAAVPWLLAQLEKEQLAEQLVAAGHRLVHGGTRYREPVWLTEAVMQDLEGIIPLAPDHLPLELAAVRAVARQLPHARPAASFDTAFHATLPDRARVFGIPRRYTDNGVVRFGFHGLSYEFIVDELRAADALPSRLAAAHLGNGASVAAIRDGRSIDTTMGFTPTGGVVMATRSGDLDPGVLLYLMRTQGMDPVALSRVVNVDGGLRGLSGATGDMRTLLDRRDSEPLAALAVESFCYQVAKAIASSAVALGGLDAIVFTGGIGEHAPAVRARICEQLSWCGVSLASDRNAAHAPVISTDDSPVTARIVPTNEELMIVRHLRALLEKGGPTHAS